MAATPTTIPETVTLPSEVVLKAVAALHAIGEYDAHRAAIERNDGVMLATSVEEWCMAQASALQEAAFGHNEKDDWISDPEAVERYARAHEMTAHLLELHHEELGWDYKRQADELRRAGVVVRERGDVNAA